jgi:hypothetical protein
MGVIPIFPFGSSQSFSPQSLNLFCLLLIQVALSTSERLATQCYTVDNAVSNFWPCDPSNSSSSCCADGFLCYSNLLCAPPRNHQDEYYAPFFLSDCTDSSSSAPECASQKLCGNGKQSPPLRVSSGQYICFSKNLSDCPVDLLLPLSPNTSAITLLYPCITH